MIKACIFTPVVSLIVISSLRAAHIEGQWRGISNEDIATTAPPDPHGAAGPQGVLATVNRCIGYFGKRSGVHLWTNVDDGAPTGCVARPLTDTISAVAHGLVVGDRVVFTGSPVPAGLSEGQIYFVSSRSTDSFHVSATAGGAAVDITSAGLDVKYRKAVNGPVDLRTFFRSANVPDGNYCDPKVLFDTESRRFFVLMQDNATSSPYWSYFFIAASKSEHPLSYSTNDWYFYRVDMAEVGNQTLGGDYPGFGLDSRAVYVTYNMYGLPMNETPNANPESWGLPANHVRIFVLPKAGLISGTLEVHGVSAPTGFTLQPVSPIGSSDPGNLVYFAQIDGPAARVWRLRDPLGSRSLAAFEVPIPPTGTPLVGAPQKDTTIRLDTVTPFKAQGNAFWHDGSLWFCYTGANPVGRARVWYYEIRTHEAGVALPVPLLKRSGMIGDELPEAWTMQPAIGGNQFGDVCIVYTQTSGSGWPTIMYTTLSHYALPWETFEPPRSVIGSNGYYKSDLEPGELTARWGDYATVSSDPNDGSFWICHEYSRGSASDDNWGTFWAQIVVPHRTYYIDLNNPCGLPDNVQNLLNDIGRDLPWLQANGYINPFNWGTRESTPQEFTFGVPGERLCVPGDVGKIWNKDAQKWQYYICRADGTCFWSDEACIDLPGYTFSSDLFCLGGPWKTITEGINRSTDGDALTIKAAHYNETFRITKSLTITGYGGTVIIGKP